MRILGCAVTSLIMMAFSAAYAGDVEAHCVAGAEAQGVDASVCSCIVDAIGDDEALSEEFLGVQGEDDMASASDELQSSVEHCEWK